MPDWTDEQLAILAHEPDTHGRVFAGPGTGKSTTVLSLAERLQTEYGIETVHVITFTRAATAELALKVVEEGHALEPTTLHSFALSLLMRNPGLSGLPEPLRIPDDWERKELIRSDLARRLRLRFDDVTVRTVDQLEREMASQWESLRPGQILFSDIDPELRNAYLAVWGQHRAAFGYSLFAEMPLYAKALLEDHPDLGLGDLDLLIVDEYQDLNRCEIGMLQAAGQHEVRILAVGDDDQSIYGFRMADPAGIREFLDHFPGAADYAMSESHRCGSRILDAARLLIESAPGRPPKEPLTPGTGNPEGVFEYLSFRNQDAECDGVAQMAAHLVDFEGLKPSDIAIMIRGDANAAWSAPVRAALAEHGVPATNVEQALAPIGENNSRVAIALGRLADNPEDSLAWWALLDCQSGISDDFVTAVAEAATADGLRFASRLREIPNSPVPDATERSQTAAKTLVGRVVEYLSQLDVEGAPASEFGWAEWLIETAAAYGAPVSEEFERILREVGKVTPQEEGIGHFLNQLEPVTKDIALQTEGVAIMTMTRSKGLTYRAAIVMGVESGVIPSPRNSEDEERRLLYVAMTRPREFLYLTMATRRTGPTARSGSPRVGATRSRSPFFLATPIGPHDGAAYIDGL